MNLEALKIIECTINSWRSGKYRLRNWLAHAYSPY